MIEAYQLTKGHVSQLVDEMADVKMTIQDRVYPMYDNLTSTVDAVKADLV